MGISDFFKRKKDLDKEVKQEAELVPVEEQEAPADEPVVAEEEIPEEEEDKYFITFDEAVSFCEGFDRDHIWAFCAGQTSDDFRGNPKYLFTYISKYRKDIKAYWFCNSPEVIGMIREQGFNAFSIKDPMTQYLFEQSGVLVAENAKSVIPLGFKNIKYVNLWHGVGSKSVERNLFTGDLVMSLADKYIRNNTLFRDNQLLVVTSPSNEEDNKNDMWVDEDKLIRSGYFRCMYQKYYEPISTFEHDLIGSRGLPSDTKTVVYAPTYRLGGEEEIIPQAFPDFERLYKFCEDNHILFIFKVHPLMENRPGFISAKEAYGDKPYFLFWDNINDFYEIIDKTDLAIIDYSSIFSDFLAAGVKHYIRYVFDLDMYIENGLARSEEVYYSRTAGTICKDFDSLLEAIKTFENETVDSQVETLTEELWGYSKGKEDFDNAVDQILGFEPQTREHKTLYTFDIFDTLITRKVLSPLGIFYKVREKMEKEGDFPVSLIRNYPAVRHTAEMNVREFYGKTLVLRDSEKVEITFEEIFDRLKEIYLLTDEQVELLKTWEIEAEYEDSLPIPERIEEVKKLHEAGETVLLVSDMYLSKEFISKLLYKADPVLCEIPFYLSNEYGVLKSSNAKLFLEVYKHYQPRYDFGRWIHCGDNQRADINMPQKIHIETNPVPRIGYDAIQNALKTTLSSYDGFLVSAIQARMNDKLLSDKAKFTVSFISLLFVPYIDWVIRDAERNEFKTLYFISRDGHHLKRIADAIIKERGLDIKTKYIYASRITTRVPSYIDEIDEGFYDGYGNLVNIQSKEKLFDAMLIDEEKFRELFPALDPDSIDYDTPKEFAKVVTVIKNNKAYNDYLLEVARQQREWVCPYFVQEMDFSEKFAMVEYWGRGYTQDCLLRIFRHITGNSEMELDFYYSRSVLPSLAGSIRHNFTTNNVSQFFIEAIFSNVPYKSVSEYVNEDGVWKPKLKPLSVDEELYLSMQNLLPEFASQYAAADLTTPEDTDRLLYEFALNYFNNNKQNEQVYNIIGSLIDSVFVAGKKRQYAPKFTMEDLDDFRDKKKVRSSTKVTTSITMSYLRADQDVQERYRKMYQILPNDNVAGGTLLSDEQIEENEQFRTKYEKLCDRAAKYRNLYDDLAPEIPVENKILIIQNGTKFSNTLNKIYDAFEGNEVFEVKKISSNDYEKKNGIEALVREVASARYIIVNVATACLSEVSFKDETTVILVPADPFNIFYQGLAVRYPLKWKKKYMTQLGKMDVDVMQLPGDASEEMFRTNYCHNVSVDVSLRGNINTDVYFKSDREALRAKLDEKYPMLAGKKLLLYMPAIRARYDMSGWAECFNMHILKNKLPDDYRVVINFNPEEYEESDYPNIKNGLDVPDFSVVIENGILNNRQLLMIADVVVGDYRASFFETAILRKPAFSSAYDKDTFKKRPNVMFKDIDSIMFAPLVKTSEELASQLEHLDEYDYSKMDEFREKYFGGCTGNSAEQVKEFVFNHYSAHS